MRVLLIDIETTPNLSYTWGKWEQSVIQFKKEWELLSFAFKELGQGKVQCIARPDFEDIGDASLTQAVWRIVDEADVLIGHNIDQFDNRKIRAKFVEHGLKPPKPYKTIDTKKIARAQFAFNSNALNDLAKVLRLGNKLPTGGFDLWLGCMSGDPAAWKKMIAYNKHDVLLLEKVYMRMKAWFPNHPNLALIDDGDREGCPVCASTKTQRRGFQVLKTRRNARFQCQSCGHWFHRAA